MIPIGIEINSNYLACLIKLPLYMHQALLKFISYALAGIMIFFLPSCKTSSPTPTTQAKLHPPLNAEVEAKITELMARMDTVDKVGEMTQLSIDMISVGQPYGLAEPHQLDTAKLRNVLLDLRVGSLLNVGGHAYPLDYWREIMGYIQKIATEEKPTGIPVLYGIDAIHGSNYTQNSTLFPQQLALAATWNPAHATRMGEITAYETRASGIPWNFSPDLDIGRDPRWSRLWETFGEDVLLASTMGVALLEGNQGSDISDPTRVATCIKHFLGYSMPWTGKDRTQVWLPERQMREYFLPTFKKAIEADAASIMICSGEINGIPVHANKEILTDLLRDELGFTGLAVSDWEDIVLLHTRHRVSSGYKESIKMAINAGIDMSMVPIDLQFPVLLKELIAEGEVPMKRINESVRRILRAKFQLGLFEETIYPKETYDKFGSAEHTQASFEAALESITLLKNEDGILPLSKNDKILLTGPNAHSITDLNGGWSRTWQGTDASQHETNKKTIFQALRDKVGQKNIAYVAVADTPDNYKAGIQAAVRQARSSKVAVICVGEHPYTEVPGNINDLTLAKEQVELVEAIAATGTPIVLLIVAGRPRIINAIEPLSKGILMGFFPGNEGGRAIADILYGDYNPNGKLPITYPRHVNDLMTYDHKGTDQIKYDFSPHAFNPQFAFGHGLSYTNYAYSKLKAPKEVPKDGEINISIDIENTGKRAGKEVVQVYITDKVASVTPSVKRLRAFEKIMLDAGEKKTIRFSIAAKDLSFVGHDNTFILEAGEFDLAVGDQKTSFEVVK